MRCGDCKHWYDATEQGWPGFGYCLGINDLPMSDQTDRPMPTTAQAWIEGSASFMTGVDFGCMAFEPAQK